jgi:hypothetical protein
LKRPIKVDELKRHHCTFFLSDIGSLNTEIMKEPAVVNVGVVVVFPNVSIGPMFLVDSLKTGFATAGIDREARNWQKKQKMEHSDTIGKVCIQYSIAKAVALTIAQSGGQCKAFQKELKF